MHCGLPATSQNKPGFKPPIRHRSVFRHARGATANPTVEVAALKVPIWLHPLSNYDLCTGASRRLACCRDLGCVSCFGRRHCFRIDVLCVGKTGTPTEPLKFPFGTWCTRSCPRTDTKRKLTFSDGEQFDRASCGLQCKEFRCCSTNLNSLHNSPSVHFVHLQPTMMLWCQRVSLKYIYKYTYIHIFFMTWSRMFRGLFTAQCRSSCLVHWQKACVCLSTLCSSRWARPSRNGLQIAVCLSARWTVQQFTGGQL